LAENTLATLAAQIADQTFAPRTPIFEEGKKTKAALYFVRSGKVELKSSSGRHQIIDDGGYFGDDLLTIDVGGLQQTDQIEAQYNVTTLGEDVVVGLLKIEDLRKYIDTTSIGQGKRLRGHDSMAGIDIPLDSLEKHAILGAGTFGQVGLGQ
jgi:signal-transduction protein with cAMP-binding, CBS, and nucleotidyltransferase domain